jgi:hypothetical protein
MSVRDSSAQRSDIPISFSVRINGFALTALEKRSAVSSPKAKVTRSNRVGRAN